jgi:hypothetical protein
MLTATEPRLQPAPAVVHPLVNVGHAHQHWQEWNRPSWEAEELSARALRVPPFTEMGNVIDLDGLFGGPDALLEAIDALERRLIDVR